MEHLPDWLNGLPAAVTVTNEEGKIIVMNRRAGEEFAGSGGLALLNSNVLDCHPEPARSKLEAMLARGAANHYTIDKSGRRRMIHQLPWFCGGALAGLVEISVGIPVTLPHFDRS